MLNDTTSRTTGTTDARNAVQYPAFQIVSGVERDILVGHELQGIHHVERLRLDGDGLVRIGQDEQRERHLVPHFPRLQLRVDMPE